MAVPERPPEPLGTAPEPRIRHRPLGRDLAEPPGDAGVPGRRSGRLISFPVVIANHDGERYLVAMLGEHTNWVRNVRAAGGRAMLRHGRREAVRLKEVDPEARPPILRRYLASAPGARPHIPVDRHAPLEDFEQVAPKIPVFRITADHAARQKAG
jgi:hypothetical protein